jgi:hypothetical protein
MFRAEHLLHVVQVHQVQSWRRLHVLLAVVH